MIIHQLVVVADAHLRRSSAADEDAFLALLDTVPARGDALLLAGDIYDFWYTYTHLIPRDCVRTTARLIELARHLPVFMLGGNHDRWGDTFWRPQTDIQFERQRLRLDVGGRRVLALHGDGLHEERSVPAVLNRVLDAQLVQRVFNVLPPAVGFRIAHRLAHNPAFAQAHPDVVDTAAARQLAWAFRTLATEAGIDLLVMGHTHRTALSEVAPGRWYLNPGPWLTEHRFATVTAATVELGTFD